MKGSHILEGAHMILDRMQSNGTYPLPLFNSVSSNNDMEQYLEPSKDA